MILDSAMGVGILKYSHETYSTRRAHSAASYKFSSVYSLALQIALFSAVVCLSVFWPRPLIRGSDVNTISSCVRSSCVHTSTGTYMHIVVSLQLLITACKQLMGLGFSGRGLITSRVAAADCKLKFQDRDGRGHWITT